MLKLKDFPPSSDFKSVLARHHDDFVAMLTRWGPPKSCHRCRPACGGQSSQRSR